MARSRAICVLDEESYVSTEEQAENFYKVEAASKDLLVLLAMKKN